MVRGHMDRHPIVDIGPEILVGLDADQCTADSQRHHGGVTQQFEGVYRRINLPVGIHDRDAARAALRRLGATPTERASKAPTAREKAYLAAIEALFGDGPQRDREAAYSRAMSELKDAYPEDVEATA